MSTDHHYSERATNHLREVAERRVRPSSTDVDDMSTEEIQRLVYELQIHQEELEIQNEELRGVQVELQTSRDRYADLYDFAPVGYLTLDGIGNVTEANLTAATMLNVARSRLVGSRFAMHCHPRSRAELNAYLDNVRNSDERLSCELELTNAASFFARLEGRRSAPSTDPQQQCRLAMIDVTARVNADRLLQESHDKYKSLIENANGILWAREAPTGPFSYVSPNAERLLGYPVSRWLESRNFWSSLIHEDDRDQAIQSCRDRVTQGWDRVIEYRMIAADDREIWMHDVANPVRDGSGNVAEVSGLLIDMTARKQAQRQATEKDRRLRSLANALPVLISYLDHELRYQFSNDAHHDWFGLTPDELQGKTIHETLGEREILDSLRVSLEGREVTFECELNHNKRGVRYVQILLVPDCSDEGSVNGVHKLCVDITDREIVARQDARRRAIAVKLERLTADERSVYDFLIRGKTKKAIAHDLDIGMRTVDRRQTSILTKLEVESLPELLQQLADIQGVAGS